MSKVFILVMVWLTAGANKATTVHMDFQGFQSMSECEKAQTLVTPAVEKKYPNVVLACEEVPVTKSI